MKEIIKKLLRENLKSNVVYHGTPNKHDFDDRGEIYNGTFFSPNENEAKSYGKYIYKIELKPNLNLFNSTELYHTKILFSVFNELYDDYYNEDELEYYIKTPEQLMYSSDNWNPIEKTDGVLEWLEDKYDGVMITEGGVLNILLFNPIKEKIKTINYLGRPMESRYS